MKKFYWIEKDYQNNSLNNLARNLTEYYTADLLSQEYDVCYSQVAPTDNSQYYPIGKLGISSKAFEKNFDFHVSDTHIINSIVNYNLYFKNNTEEQLSIPVNLKGTFDCLVSLASGNMVETNPNDIGLQGHNHYVIDISPTAIHQTMGLYRDSASKFTTLDLFDITAVKKFISECQGTRGFFVISNCFFYIISSLIYDVQLRLKMQNELIEILANDKIEWYVSIYTADGIHHRCISASELINQSLDERFYIFPWIQK
jgi:hypothetical protein